jgi:hypothetical protein
MKKSITKKSAGTRAKAVKGSRKAFTSPRKALSWAWFRSLDRLSLSTARWRSLKDSWQAWWR